MNVFKKNLSLILFFIFGSITLWTDEPSRTWTNIKGDKMEASLIRFKKDKIEIKRDDGRTFILAPTMFSEEDQKYLVEARTRADSSGEFWSKERAIYHLTRQKWATGELIHPLQSIRISSVKIDLMETENLMVINYGFNPKEYFLVDQERGKLQMRVINC